MRRALAAVALVLLAAFAASAGAFTKEFPDRWRDAGEDEPKKNELLDRLVSEGTVEAAKLLLGVVLLPAETGGTVDHALNCLARLEGKPGDEWIREEMRRGKQWADRAILVRAVGRRATEEARRLLFAALADKAWQVQAAAIDALRRHRSADTVEALLKLWEALDPKKEESARLAGDCRDALLVITGKDFLAVQDAKSWWSQNSASFKPEKASEVIERHDDVTGERAPRLFDDIVSRRVVLVLDTSASMLVPTGAEKDPKKAPGGITRFEHMRREVRRVIEDFPPDATFNLVTFGDKVTQWKKDLVIASESHKRQAVKFVDGLKPEGQTNSFGALEQAFKSASADTVYFLSDGYPTVGKVDFNVILADVRKWNATRNLRVHTIAFIAGDGKPLKVFEGDKSLPKEFMRRLAQENGGRYKLVE